MPGAWEIEELRQLYKEEREEYAQWFNEIYGTLSEPVSKKRRVKRRAPAASSTAHGAFLNGGGFGNYRRRLRVNAECGNLCLGASA